MRLHLATFKGIINHRADGRIIVSEKIMSMINPECFVDLRDDRISFWSFERGDKIIINVYAYDYAESMPVVKEFEDNKKATIFGRLHTIDERYILLKKIDKEEKFFDKWFGSERTELINDTFLPVIEDKNLDKGDYVEITIEVENE